MLPEAQERFNLRISSELLLSPVFDALKSALRSQNEKARSNFEIDAMYSGDSGTINWINGSSYGELEVSLLDDDLLERLGSIGDFDVNVKVKASDKDHVDGNYAWSTNTSIDDDLGGIELSITIPLDDILREKTMNHLFRWARGVMAHEFQHMIQRVIHKRNLDPKSRDDIVSHIKDPDEVDARVEEILAYSEKELSYLDVDNFENALIDQIDDYLTRNGVLKEDENYLKWKNEMIDSHLIRFREKFELWG